MTDAEMKLNGAKVCLARALEDLEAAANEDSNVYVQECPRIHHAAEELRATRRMLDELATELELAERQR
jgi:hypothetical protein